MLVERVGDVCFAEEAQANDRVEKKAKQKQVSDSVSNPFPSEHVLETLFLFIFRTETHLDTVYLTRFLGKTR